MNFVLSTLILVILLLPGSLVIQAYYTAFREKKTNIHIPFNDLIYRGIIFSLILHCAGICIIGLLKYEVDFDLFYWLISGKEEIDLEKMNFKRSFLQFMTYTFIICSSSFVLSKLFRRLAQARNWDINYFSLRNVNYWYLIFSARYLEIENVQGSLVTTDLIVIDVLTDKDVLYTGILKDFNYSPRKDELENIILSFVAKRNWKKDPDDNRIEKHTTGIPANIPGDVFVIPVKQIININIHYIKVSPPPTISIESYNQELVHPPLV